MRISLISSRRRRTWMVSVIAIASVSIVPLLEAQQTVASHPAAAGDAILARPVTLRFDNISLRSALDAIARKAGVQVQYQYPSVAANERAVTLHATKLPLGVALETILGGTHLAVGPVADGVITIVTTTRVTAAGGTIAGVVTDSKTRQPLRGATMTLDDTVNRTRTDDNGRYRFASVPAGPHRVAARFVGFARQARLVSVIDDSVTTVNIALESSANTLDQVVVTATGEQRVRELGHVVAHINADSLVKSAPISNVVELLQARVPGLQVLTGSGGVAGGSASLRLRGQATALLDAEPIVIVDGVRFKTDNLVEVLGNGFMALGQDNRNNQQGEVRSLLNDLNPNDIETVEVVKGPSASTLYGPDAANGVIVITTKRGHAGKTEFRWYAHPLENSVPTTRVPPVYQAFGHDPVTLQPFLDNCTLEYQYNYHLCVLDSIAPLPALANSSVYSMVAKSRPAWQYGASVSGGSSAVRYFLSGNYDSQTGALQPSPALAQIVKNVLGTTSIGDAIRNPNVAQNLGTHATVSTDFGARGSASATVGYNQTYRRSSPVQTGQFSAIVPGVDTTNLPFAYFDPYALITVTEEQASRLNAVLTGTANPVGWANLTATAGLDLAPSVIHSVLPRAGNIDPNSTHAYDSRRSNVGRTVNLGATGTGHAGIWSFRSSLGAQYTYTHVDGIDEQGYVLAPGSSSIQTANHLSTGQFWLERATLGSYGEEVVGLRDRLYFTASLRVDGSTSFGDAYRPVPFPKAGVSWIASDEPFLKNVPGLTELRLRYSFGASSRYPTSGMKLGLQSASAALLDGSSQTYFYRSSLGNPLLRPERTRESEYGADATLGSIVHLGLTWFNRRTTDELQVVANAAGLLPAYRNLGLVGAHGFEATTSIGLANTPRVRADLQFNYSFVTDKVLSIGNAGNAGQDGGVPGYSTTALFFRSVTGVADTVGGHADGIVLRREIVYNNTMYRGVTVPPRTYGLTPTVALFQSRLRLSTSLDRQTGFVLLNGNQYGGQCVAAADKNAPLLEQAKCIAGDNVAPGDFTRWRELTATVDIPKRFLRIDMLHLAFGQASVSLQGRNLKLWTGYRGTDPESRSDLGLGPNAAGLPQARAWSFRFDVTP